MGKKSQYLKMTVKVSFLSTPVSQNPGFSQEVENIPHPEMREYTACFPLVSDTIIDYGRNSTCPSSNLGRSHVSSHC